MTDEQQAGIIANQTLGVRIAKSPVTVQNLRHQVVVGAIQFAKELKKHKFEEISEIVRVCTALGVERAYLRGLQHPVASEEEIDRFIYRFDLKGAVPFVDNVTRQIPEKGKIYFKPTTNMMLFFCTTNDDNVFLSITNNIADFVVEGTVNKNKIQTDFVDQTILPDYTFIPKYATSHIIDGVDYICSVLNNRFPTQDSNNCITTMEISDPRLGTVEPNRLVPINENSFPYTTPSASLSLDPKIFPEAVRIKTVMDGSPLENEKVTLANRFELTGTVKIDVGVDITVDMTVDDVNGGTDIVTDPPDLPPGQIKIGDRIFPNLPRIAEPFEYHGPGLFILDPVKGEGTLFSKELDVNDYIEIKREEAVIGGKFLTVGDDYIYYQGQEFIERFNRTTGSVQIKLNGIIHNLLKDSSNQSVLGQVHELNNIRQIHEYNAKYKITKEFASPEKEEFLSSRTFSVEFVEDDLDPYKGELLFSGSEDLSTIFEDGEGFALSSIKDEDGVSVPNVNMSFSEISNDENKLKGCFVYFPDDVSKRMKISSTSSITLTKLAKTSSYLSEFTGASSLPTFTYHQVRNIISDTELEITPDATNAFEGKISRVGFCAYSQSASPSLTTQGLGDNSGVGYTVQILKNGYLVNSNDFFMPEARTDKVVLYTPAQITQNPSASGAISEYGMNVYNPSSFNLSLGTELKVTEIPDTILNEKIIGTLYFRSNEGDSQFITIESINDEFKPVSHGFAEDDMLKLYRKTTGATEIGELIDGSSIGSDYDKCGVHLQVIEILTPNRFLVDYSAALKSFFDTEQTPGSTTHIRATNGSTLEYWSKYFNTVYLDGTTDYSNDTRESSTETIVLSKKYHDSNTEPNHAMAAMTFNNIKLGLTPIKITSDTDGKGGFSIASTATDADAFIFVTKDELNTPPRLMDVFALRSAKFKG